MSFTGKMKEHFASLDRNSVTVEELGMTVYGRPLTPYALTQIDRYADENKSDVARLVKTCQMVFVDENDKPLIKKNELPNLEMEGDFRLLARILNDLDVINTEDAETVEETAGK